MTVRRVVAVVLAVVVVAFLFALSRGKGDTADPEHTPTELAALAISSCGGGPVDVVVDGQVFCRPDQPHGDVSTITAGDMVSRLWWILALVFACFVLMGFSNLWNGRAG